MLLLEKSFDVLQTDTSLRAGRDLYKGSQTEIVRERIGLEDSCTKAALSQVRLGLRDFRVGVRPFVQQRTPACLQGRAEDVQGPRNRRYGSGGQNAGMTGGSQYVFGSLSLYGYISQGERVHCVLDAARFFADGFRECELHVGQDDCEWYAGKAGAGARIDYVPRVREMAPRQHGIEHVLDGGFTGVENSGEIEVPIGLDDEFEVPRCERY